MKRMALLFLLMASATLAAQAAYTIQLRDGKVITSDDAMLVKDGMVYFTKAGVFFYIPAEQVDQAATDRLNTEASAQAAHSPEVSAAPAAKPVVIGEDQLDVIKKRSRLANEGQLGAGSQPAEANAPAKEGSQPAEASVNRSDLQTKLADLMQQQSSLQQEQNSLTTQLSDLKDNYNQSPQNDDKQRIQSQIDSVSAQLGSVQNQLAGLQGQISSAQQEMMAAPVEVDINRGDH